MMRIGIRNKSIKPGRIVSGLLATALLVAGPGTLCSYADETDNDTYIVYFDGTTYEYESGTTDLTHESGTTVMDNELVKEEYDSYAPADGNEISEERLSDSVIDYDELGTFVQKYNPTIVNTRNSIESTESMYEALKGDLVSEYIDSINNSRSAKSDGDADEYATFMEYKETYRQAIQSYNTVIDNLSSQSTIRSLKSVEKSLTFAAQSLMISYHTIQLSKTVLTKSAEVYAALYDATGLMVQAGTATEAELMDAYDSMENANTALDSLVVNETSVYNSLCLLLGLDVDAGYTIGELPDPDTSYLESIDTAADQEKYVNSYSEVTSARKTSSGGDAERIVKDAKVQEAESDAIISYQSVYNSLKEAQSEYDAALISYENAMNNWNIAESKNSLGMLSRAEYLEEQLALINGAGELYVARVSLFNAINTYQWGLVGVG